MKPRRSSAAKVVYGTPQTRGVADPRRRKMRSTFLCAAVIFVCPVMGWSVPAMLECCNQGGSHERLVFIGPELAAVDVAALERAERSFDKTI